MNPRTADDATASPEQVLAFWFGAPPTSKPELDACMKRWFAGGADQDAAIAERFAATIDAAARRELGAWEKDARSRLALILLLDQFPRSVHRGTRLAFAQDSRALDLALSGMGTGLDRRLAPLERVFFYMPLQHAESVDVQEHAVAAFSRLAEEVDAPLLRDALAGAAKYARQHHDIIARFGRFPHRNAALGRRSTPAEAAYLAQGAPKFGQ